MNYPDCKCRHKIDKAETNRSISGRDQHTNTDTTLYVSRGDAVERKLEIHPSQSLRYKTLPFIWSNLNPYIYNVACFLIWRLKLHLKQHNTDDLDGSNLKNININIYISKNEKEWRIGKLCALYLKFLKIISFNFTHWFGCNQPFQVLFI